MTATEALSSRLRRDPLSIARSVLPFLAAYVWPLDVPPVLTSSYGEFRDHHFHGGLDLSTGGRTGLPVRALANGAVIRVRSSGVGYGRAIYLLLDDGRTAVYAHLDAFEDDLAAWVAAVQESTARYEQDLEPPAGRFRYERGQIVGYSGESGAGPPHLHVELRQGDVGLNPLVHGLPVPDRTAPVIEALWISPANLDAWAWNPPARKLETRGGGGSFGLKDAAPVWGRIRLAVQARDTDGASERALGLHKIEAWLDGRLIYTARLDSISWLETSEVKAFFDYPARERRYGTQRAYALYASPALRAGAAPLGSPSLEAGPGLHELRVRCRDAAGNVAELRASLEWKAPDHEPSVKAGDRTLAGKANLMGDVLRVSPARSSDSLETQPPLDPSSSIGNARIWEVPEALRGPLRVRSRSTGDGEEEIRLQLGRAEPGWKSEIVSEDGVLRLTIGADAAFEAHPVAIESPRRESPRFPWGETVSAAYRVLPEALPWREGLGLEVRFPGRVPDHAGLFLVANGGASFVGAEAKDSALSASTRQLGTFVAVRDTVPPTIGSPAVRSPRSRARQAGSLVVRWAVADRGAGFGPDGVRLSIDGVAVPVEYDADAGRAVWRPHRPPPPGTRDFRLEVQDRLGNRAFREGRFTHR